MRYLQYAAISSLLMTGNTLAEPIEILITAGRTAEPGLTIPAGYQIIDKEQLAASGASNLVDALAQATSVQITDGVGGGGYATIDMRGFGGTAISNVAILIDGRKINSSTDMATPYLNSIAIDDIERIEIIEGSAGTLFGNQAVGGVINIIRRSPKENMAEAKAEVGSYQKRSVQTVLSTALSPDTHLKLTAQKSASDNYRDHNDSEMNRLGIDLDWKHGAGESTFSYAYLDDFIETPGALLASEIALDRTQVGADFVNDYVDVKSHVWRLSSNQLLSHDWRLESDISFRKDDREFIQSYRGSGPSTSVTTQDRETFEINPRFFHKSDYGQLILGSDLQYSDYLLVSSFGPQGTKQKIGALYAQLQTSPIEAMSLIAGLRHARVADDINNGGTPVELDDNVTVGALGLTYRPHPSLRLFARADQNYRFAKVDEHTNPVWGQPVGLKTQTGISFEGGVEWRQQQDELKWRAYRLNLNDEISFDASGFSNINLDRTRRIGTTFSGQKALNRNTLIGFSYEYIDSEVTDGPYTGSKVPLVAEHNAKVFASQRIDAHWQLSGELSYLSERFIGSDYANTEPNLGARTLANLQAQYHADNWLLTLRVNNLFNEIYNESGAKGWAASGYNPAPKRNFAISARYNF